MKMISHNTGAMIEFADKESTTKALNLAKEKGMDVKYSNKIKDDSQMRCKYYNTPKGCTNPNCQFQHIDDPVKPIEQKINGNIPKVVFPQQSPQQIPSSSPFPFSSNTTPNININNNNPIFKNINQSKINVSKPPIIFHQKNKPKRSRSPSPSLSPNPPITPPIDNNNNNNNNNTDVKPFPTIIQQQQLQQLQQSPFQQESDKPIVKFPLPSNNNNNNNNNQQQQTQEKQQQQQQQTNPFGSVLNNNNNNIFKINTATSIFSTQNVFNPFNNNPQTANTSTSSTSPAPFPTFPVSINNNNIFNNESNNKRKMFIRKEEGEDNNKNNNSQKAKLFTSTNNNEVLTRQQKLKQEEKEEEELTSTIKPIQAYNPEVIKIDPNYPIPSPITHYTVINETENNNYVDGKCNTMCPREEMENRKANYDQDPGIVTAADSDKLHILERPHPNIKDLVTNKELHLEDMIIKKFVRSAADNNYTDDLNKIRTPDVLLKTMEYILNNIIDRDKLGSDPRFGTERTISLLEIYNYLWDRTRAIRMDCTSQQYNKGYRNSNDVIRIFEYISRYHIICDHELNYLGEGHSNNGNNSQGGAGATNVYSSQQNMEQLNACLSQLLDLYDDMRIRHDPLLFSPYEAEFRAYFLLLRLMRTTESGDSSSVAELTFSSSKIPKDCLSDPNIKAFFKLYKYIKLNDYNHFFKLIYEVPFLFGCLLRRFYPIMRNKAINTLCQGTGSEYEINEVKKIFGIEDDDEFERFMKYYKLELNDNDRIFFGKNTKYEIPSFSFPMYPSPYLSSLTSNISRRDILYYGSRRIQSYNLPQTLPNYSNPVSEKLMEKLKQKKQTITNDSNYYRSSDESLPPPSSLPPLSSTTLRRERRESVDITSQQQQQSSPIPPKPLFPISTTNNNNNNNATTLFPQSSSNTFPTFSSPSFQSSPNTTTTAAATTTTTVSDKQTSTSSLLLTPPHSDGVDNNNNNSEIKRNVLTPEKNNFYIPHQPIVNPKRPTLISASTSTSSLNTIDTSNVKNIITVGEEFNERKQMLMYKTICNELIENQKVIIGISVMNTFKLKSHFIKWRDYVKEVKESRYKRKQNEKYQHEEMKKQLKQIKQIKIKYLMDKQKLKIEKNYFHKLHEYVKYNKLIKSLTEASSEVNIKQIINQNQFINQNNTISSTITTINSNRIRELPQIKIKNLITNEIVDKNPSIITYGCKILFTHVVNRCDSEKYKKLLHNISEQFNTYFDNENNSFKLVDEYCLDNTLRVLFNVVPFTSIDEEQMNGNCSIVYLHYFEDINDMSYIESILTQLNAFYINKPYSNQFRQSIYILYTISDESFKDFSSYQNVLNERFNTLSELNVQFLHYTSNDFKDILSIILNNIPKFPLIYQISLQKLVVTCLSLIINENDSYDSSSKKFNLLLDQILQISKSIYLPCTDVRSTNHISDINNEVDAFINILHISSNNQEITLEILTKEIQRILKNLHFNLESLIYVNGLLSNKTISVRDMFYGIIYFILMKFERNFEIYFKDDYNLVDTVLGLFIIAHNSIKPQKNKLILFNEEKEVIKKQKVNDDPILEKFKQANAKYREEFRMNYRKYLNYDNE